tara:strand:+ start:225 stop:926 length:702 start_codon:yes stop_codon:yes gene_type:complete
MAQWKQLIHSGNDINDLAIPSAAVSMNSNLITNVTNPANAQDAATKAYVDSAVIADTHMGSTDLTVDAGRTITLDGNSANALEFVDGTDLVMKFVTTTGSELVEITDLKVTGDLSVTGATITTTTETISIADNTLVLNSDNASASVDSGFVVQLGTGSDNNPSLWFDCVAGAVDTTGRWVVGSTDDAAATIGGYAGDVMTVRIDGAAINASSTEVPVGHLQYHDGELWLRVED